MAKAKQAAADKMELSIKMELNKETKRMVRYESTDDDSPLGNVYIAKSAFPNGFPDSIVVTAFEE